MSSEEDDDSFYSSDESDYTDDGHEGKKGYRPGGYHPVQVRACVSFCLRFS